MDTISVLIDEKGSAVHATRGDATVLEAVQTMCAHRVGALLVCDDAKNPVGMFTERDVMSRVILAKKDPASTRVADVMSRDIVCIGPTTTIHEAMAVMTSRRCRHLPVMSGDSLTGMISIGDLVRWQSRHQDVEIRLLSEYVAGKYPG